MVKIIDGGAGEDLRWPERQGGGSCSASLDAIVRAAPVGMGIVRDRVFHWVNRRFCELVGYTPDELLGRSSLFLYESEEEFRRVGEVKYRMISERGAGEVETRMIRSDGAVVPVLLSSTYLTPADPSEGVVFTTQDLSELQRLDDERSRLAEIVEGSVDGISTISADMKVVYFNRAGLDLIGYPPDKAFTPMPLSRLFAEPTHQGVLEGLMDKVASDGPYELDTWIRRLDGETVEVHQVILPHRDRAGQVTHYSTVLRDLTERRRQEADQERLSAQLLHSQKMEAIGRLAGGVAHDFNNILTAISGFATFARESLRSDDPVSSDLDEVILASARASALTKQLLIFSSQQDYVPVLMKLPVVIDDLSRMLSRLLGENIELDVSHESEDLWLRADPHQMEQVIVNLAVNARDAMPGGGRLSIRVSTKRLTTVRCSHCAKPLDGDFLEVVVRDTGCGMVPDTLEHLFEPFFTTKELGKGTGLGLSVVHGVVLKSSGHIEVRSTPGEGTAFTLLFPRETPGAADKSRSATTYPTVGTGTILLVEDEPMVRRFAKRMLEQLGYEVLEAGDSTGAVAQFEKVNGCVDLLLSDIVLPGRSGLQLYQRLLSLKEHLPALFISGYHQEDLAGYGFSSTELDLLPKPFTSSVLARRVGAAIARSVAARGHES